MAFWLEKGVDGFRVDAVRHIYEVKDLLRYERPSGQKKQYSAVRSLQQPTMQRIHFLTHTESI
jgi:glycosidase